MGVIESIQTDIAQEKIIFAFLKYDASIRLYIIAVFFVTLYNVLSCFNV